MYLVTCSNFLLDALLCVDREKRSDSGMNSTISGSCGHACVACICVLIWQNGVLLGSLSERVRAG